MMNDRIAHFGSVDKNTSRVVDKRLRRMQEIKKKKNIQEKAQQLDSFAIFSGSSEDESMPNQVTIPIYSLSTPMRSHKQIVKTGTNIYIPPDILKYPKLVSSCTRNKITPTAMSSTLSTITEICGGDTSALNLHSSTAHQYKIETSNSIAQQIK